MTDAVIRYIVPFIGTLLAAVSLARPAFAVELRNDGWTSNQPKTFQGDFDTGDIAAARLVPPRDCPCQVTSISFLFGGGSTNSSSLTVRIWDDSNGTLIPGGQRFSEPIEVEPDDDKLFVLDLSSDPVRVDGPFRVGIILEDDGFPAVATDADDTIRTDRNFVFDGGQWALSSAFELDGDWIIRATIEGGGELPCSSPVTNGDEPELADCLYILRSAVGQVECTPACICDPSGNGDVSVTDALFCLKRAVGQNQGLHCPCD